MSWTFSVSQISNSIGRRDDLLSTSFFLIFLASWLDLVVLNWDLSYIFIRRFIRDRSRLTGRFQGLFFDGKNASGTPLAGFIVVSYRLQSSSHGGS